MLDAIFFEDISKEHHISPDGKFDSDYSSQFQDLHVYYNEESNGRYIPRAIFADLN